jgi:hypothetical protein
VTPVDLAELTAFRRPKALLFVALLRLASGFLLAFPLAGVGLRGEGDRALFEGGGYLLLELLRLHGNALGAAARGALPLLALGLVLGSAANVALLLALNTREHLPAGAWLSRAIGLLPGQLALASGAALLKLAVLLLGATALSAPPEWLARPVDTTLARLAAFVPFALLCAAVGGFEDVAKATLVRHPASLPDGLARAWERVRTRPLAGHFGWVPYATLFVLVGLGAGEIVGALDVSRAGAWRVAAVFAVHQLVIVVGIACRAAWFAQAWRLTD